MNILIMGFFILAVVYCYIGWRLIIRSSMSNKRKFSLIVLLLFFASLPSIPYFLFLCQIENLWIDRLSWVGYLSMSFLTLALYLLTLADIFAFIAICFQKIFFGTKRFFSHNMKSRKPNRAERRVFFRKSLNMGILGVAGVLTGYGLYEARRRPEIVNITIPFRALPEDFENLRIVQISDIHAGPTLKRDYVEKIVEQVNSVNPDIIVFTGDIADGSVAYLKNDVAPLADLSSVYGSYFVTGNHDYLSGVAEWVDKIEQLGFTTLMNEHRVIHYGSGRILLAGVTDYSAGSFNKRSSSNPMLALAGAQPCNIKIVLAHQPMSIFACAKSGYDLQISGHTHGGQSLPWQYIFWLEPPHYISGLYKHNKTWLYVNRGTGYFGSPQRLCIPPEITLFKLTSSRKSQLT